MLVTLDEIFVAANLQREIEMVKYGKGLPQRVQNDRFIAYTLSEDTY